MFKPVYKIFLTFLFLAMSATAQANEVEIVKVVAHQNSDKTWTFAVTLKHADTGWDHYANEWQVIAPDNKILATRTLYHPHVEEQPFTRNTSGVKIPANIETVRIIKSKSRAKGIYSILLKPMAFDMGELYRGCVSRLRCHYRGVGVYRRNDLDVNLICRYSFDRRICRRSQNNRNRLR